MTINKQMSSVAPYSQLAQIYDGLMAHVNYKQWARYIDDIIRQINLTEPRILDIACGTGSLAFELERLGNLLSGQDQSEAMIEVARRKAAEEKSTITFSTNDMRDFRTRKKIEIIICLYDSMNYLQTEDAMQRMFISVYQALQSKGFFIFDMCTEWNSKIHFHNYRGEGTIHDIQYVRESRYNPRKRKQYNTFTLTNVKTKQTVHEIHEQQIYPLEVMKQLIPRQMFRIRKIYSDLSFLPPAHHDERNHFILQKMR